VNLLVGSKQNLIVLVRETLRHHHDSIIITPQYTVTASSTVILRRRFFSDVVSASVMIASTRRSYSGVVRSDCVKASGVLSSTRHAPRELALVDIHWLLVRHCPQGEACVVATSQFRGVGKIGDNSLPLLCLEQPRASV
jgi:hypothetical protein